MPNDTPRNIDVLNSMAAHAYTPNDPDVIKLMMMTRPMFDVYAAFPRDAEIPQQPFDHVSPSLPALVTQMSNMIEEEVNKELLPALRQYATHPSRENLVEVLDGIVDSVYVIFQAAYQLDLPFNEAFAEVHSNNMKKIQRDEQGNLLKRADGKLLKPEGHPKPNLFQILEWWGNTKSLQRKQYGADNW